MAQVDPKGVTQEMLAAARSRDVLGIETHLPESSKEIFAPAAATGC